MLLDRNVFGHEKFIISDSNLFSTAPWHADVNDREIRIETPENGRTSTSYDVTVCVTTYRCGSQVCRERGWCDYLDCQYNLCSFISEVCFEYIYDTDPGGGAGNWSGGGSSGGGGGGSAGGSGGGSNPNWTPPNCPYNQSLDDPPECQPGWNPPVIIVPIEVPINDSTIAENLKRLLLKAVNTPDSLHTAAQQDGKERVFTFQKVNGDTIVSWIKSGGTHSSSPTLDGNSFGFCHTHQEDDPVGGSDKNQSFDGPDIYKIYKNGPIDNYPLEVSIITTRDYYYAAVIVDNLLFKNYIRTLCNTTNVKDIEDILYNKHIDAMDLCTGSGCNWQKKTEKGVLAITANNDGSISGIKIFRSPKQSINFTLLTN